MTLQQHVYDGSAMEVACLESDAAVYEVTQLLVHNPALRLVQILPIPVLQRLEPLVQGAALPQPQRQPASTPSQQDWRPSAGSLRSWRARRGQKPLRSEPHRCSTPRVLKTKM